MPDTSPPLRTATRKKGTVAVPLLSLICILALGACGVLYFKYRDIRKGDMAQTQLLTKLSQTIQLPAANPTIVTIADRTKLSNKSLAAKVKNKDVLLIYAEAKRIIVYRPSTKKVIDMLTLAPGSVQASH